MTDRLSEFYKIDIRSSHVGLLPHLAFEGATKRNKPNLHVCLETHRLCQTSLFLSCVLFCQLGSIVYCRVVMANKDMEPELSCVSPVYKKDWTTGQALLGELKGGYMFDCSLDLAYRSVAFLHFPSLSFHCFQRSRGSYHLFSFVFLSFAFVLFA